MSIRSVAYGSLLVFLLTGCEDKQAAEIKTETEANLAALVASGDLAHGAIASSRREKVIASKWPIRWSSPRLTWNCMSVR
ncbi:MAG: hypothetical protein WD711_07440 [Dongiaceae bacterium]